MVGRGPPRSQSVATPSSTVGTTPAADEAIDCAAAGRASATAVRGADAVIPLIARVMSAAVATQIRTMVMDSSFDASASPTIDITRRVMFQHCTSCFTKYQVTEEELISAD